MKKSKLDIAFDEAVARVNNYLEPLQADLLLKLYAYYKKATQNNENPGSRKPLINAFKANALFQVRNISEEEAKREYIKLVDQHIPKS